MKKLHGLDGIVAASALVLSCAMLPASVATAQNLDGATTSALDAALVGAHRSDRNKARDPFRHPEETLAFFGLRRDMTVVEVWPGGGWYTELLAPVLQGSGKLYLAQYGKHAIMGYQGQEDAALLEKTKKFPAVFSGVQFTALWPPQDVAIAPAGSADLVLTFRNVHNWVNADYKLDAAKVFATFFTALKPGGILGIVDHRWPDAKTEDANAGNGYVSEDRIKALAKAAGFEFVASSDVNRNPKDTHDHPNGVWSLPPDLSGKPEDRAQHLAIGESDRLTLKFRKPASK